MTKKKRWIKVKTQFRGLHNWPECPHDKVNFLRSLHRHTFIVKVKMVVEHQDREVEFFLLQRDVDIAIKTLYAISNVDTSTFDLGRKSCEEIADDIYYRISEKYPREMIISVSEDGEVAAEVEFTPDG